jgi:hypothetical protein
MDLPTLRTRIEAFYSKRVGSSESWNILRSACDRGVISGMCAAIPDECSGGAIAVDEVDVSKTVMKTHG